jgi:hypothetical protein
VKFFVLVLYCVFLYSHTQFSFYTATSTFGGGSTFGQAQPTAFGGTAFKPAGSGTFGLTSQQGGTSSLFGTTTTSQAGGGLFSQPATTGFSTGGGCLFFYRIEDIPMDLYHVPVPVLYMLRYWHGSF